ncbi:DnaJ domain-containing protein [Diaporthe eres]|nr:DnaJ domain-containing protein [Diaporthe eres]
MVKIDVNQDYYADLELPQSVDTETVKKQYRKLALKYHPDRNPGSEVEAGKRFTRIQAAYEVLTNPEQKQRYDNSRRSRFPGASGVKGNPWSDVTKNYPPPPRPPGFPQRPPPPKRPGSTTGADRYAQFAKDVPPNSPRPSRKPADATWKAWEEMRPGTKAKATGGQASGSGTSARASSAPKPPGAPPPVPPRSPQKQPKGSFGHRVSRGYTPQSPSGDEPSVAGNNYFTTRTRPDLFSETSSAAQARRRQPSNPTPTSEFRDSTFMDTRQRTPYMSHGGEKLDPFQGAAGINRSRSTRETNSASYQHTDDEDSPTTSARQRRASVPDNLDNDPKGKRREKSNVNGAAEPDTSPDGFSPAPEEQYSTQQEGADGKEGSKLYAKSHFAKNEVPPKTQQATSRAGSERIFNKSFHPNPALHDLPTRQFSSEDPKPSNSGLNAFELKVRDVLSRLSAVKYSPHGMGVQSGAERDAQHPQDFRQQSRADSGNPSSFGVPFNDESFTDSHRFSRNSADNINTRFVADESDASNWQFNAGSPVDETGRPAMPRSKSGSRVGRKSPFRAQSFQMPSAEPANEGGPPQNSSFNPDEWSEKIGPQIFQSSTTQKANTARPIRNPSKKPKPVRMTAGTAGMVESDESSSGQDDSLKKPTTPGNTNGLNETASPNAMDIDPPMDYLSAKGVRNIPVEPSRPEWRAGDVKGMTPGLTPGAVPHAGGSEDTEEFRASLSDLKNVEPFAQRPTGLNSFGDLKSTLPFPSGASGQAPVAQPQPNPKPTNLHLPAAPKPPGAPPTLAVPGLKPSAAAWEKYAGDFYRYLTEWHRFNTKFSDHFHARNLEVQKKVADPGWVKSRDPSGIQEYLTWAEQDRQVRATWAQACDNHEMNVRVFMAHRDKMMK